MNSFLKVFTLAVVVTLCTTTYAVVPDGINYQAYLTNIDGSAVDTDISITFAAYNVDVGGVPLWSETQTITVEQGLFSITLGSPVNPLPAGLFDDEVFIGLFVAGEAMLPRRAITPSAYAHKAGDADTVDGVSAATLDQSGDVSLLQTDVATNASRISGLEVIGADITEVNVSGGLSGGGTMGDISISVAPEGIELGNMARDSVSSANIVDGSIGPVDIAASGVTAANIAVNSIFSSHISDGQVTANDLATGAVTPTKLDPSSAFTVAGATVNGSTSLNGSLFVATSEDIRIHLDGSNQRMRWFSPDGLIEWGGIAMNSTEAALYDGAHNRWMVYSNTNGIGLGTSDTQAGYTVTTNNLFANSLFVTGQTNVGLERVSVTYPLDSTFISCDTYGGQECHFGNTIVQCPVGKKILGGGSSSGFPAFGSISSSYPNSATSYFCSATYDQPGNSQICVAICARLE